MDQTLAVTATGARAEIGVGGVTKRAGLSRGNAVTQRRLTRRCIDCSKILESFALQANIRTDADGDEKDDREKHRRRHVRLRVYEFADVVSSTR